MSEEFISFGSFRVLPAERRLDKDGKPLAIGGRAFDILYALIERAGEVVSHRELMAKVWRDLIVDSGNLRVNIAQLRRALGDAGAVIQNVPRQGYRFVAPVFRPADRRPAAEFETEMRAVLGCSYDLLPEEERRTLRRLAIFVGAFSQDAAQFVASGSDADTTQVAAAMNRLVVKSLLISIVAADGAPRYRILDMTRAHARARLDDSGEAECVARRHAEYFSRPIDVPLAEQASTCGDRTALEQLSNARAALQWCLQRDATRVELHA